MSERKYADRFYREKLPDGVPCSHPGCLHHASHPCEGCGRIGGITPPTLAECRSVIEELLSAGNRGVFGTCPWCGAGWEGEDEPHADKCPVSKARALLDRMK